MPAPEAEAPNSAVQAVVAEEREAREESPVSETSNASVESIEVIDPPPLSKKEAKAKKSKEDKGIGELVYNIARVLHFIEDYMPGWHCQAMTIDDTYIEVKPK